MPVWRKRDQDAKDGAAPGPPEPRSAVVREGGGTRGAYGPAFTRETKEGRPIFHPPPLVPVRRVFCAVGGNVTLVGPGVGRRILAGGRPVAMGPWSARIGGRGLRISGGGREVVTGGGES